MNEQKNVAALNDVENYEQYLVMFFPELVRDGQSVPTTPEEIGIKMAQETLTHIQNLLQENKTG